jgi:Polyketide cyclase / dehydrase and lipid transport
VRRQRLESTVTIRRPVDDVFAFMIDLFNSPRVRGMTLGARKVSPGPIGLGTVVDNRTVLLGFETHLRFTVIEWDPPHAVVVSLSGPLLRSGRVTTELLGTSEGTRRVSRFDLELSPGGILLWPLLGRLLRRDQAHNDRKLKALLEASPSDTVVG